MTFTALREKGHVDNQQLPNTSVEATPHSVIKHFKKTMIDMNKPSKVLSQTSRHKHKHDKNTEFTWSHTKLA